MPKPFFNVTHEGYSVKAETETGEAELVLYGSVVKSRPYDYDYETGDYKPSAENFIVESEFLDDLKTISKCSKLNIRLNSCGGECNTAIVIYNRLRELAAGGTEITCIVDGVAMSAGSHIMCAADTVKASEGSLIMIHKSMSFMFGYYNADDLRKEAATSDAYDKAIVSAYKRKTGKADKELLKMMSAETFMTGTEAKEQGFVDELTEGESNAAIAATADGKSLIVNGRIINLNGMSCPDSLPVADIKGRNNKALPPKSSGKTADGEANKPNIDTNEGGNTMAENLDELRKENPALASSIEAEIKAQLAEENKTAAGTAVQKALADERERLAKIEAIAAQVSPELLEDAKYKNPCTAEELAYRAMSENAKKGTAFLDGMNADYKASGADGVKPVSADDAAKTETEKIAETSNFIRNTLKEEE